MRPTPCTSTSLYEPRPLPLDRASIIITSEFHSFYHRRAIEALEFSIIQALLFRHSGNRAPPRMAGGEGAMEEVSPRRNGGERPRSEGGGGVDGGLRAFIYASACAGGEPSPPLRSLSPCCLHSSCLPPSDPSVILCSFWKAKEPSTSLKSMPEGSGQTSCFVSSDRKQECLPV